MMNMPPGGSVKSKLFLLAIVLAAATTNLTHAHHSFATSYFPDKTTTIDGKVVQFLFRNPHSFLDVAAPDEKRHDQTWVVEWGGGGQLSHVGVSKDTLKPGDHVVARRFGVVLRHALAGVSLISAPLDTGQGLARDAFLGLPPQYPLFFGWDPDTQDWVSGDLVPAGIGGGYWIYLPIPATLVVAGQPYSYVTSLTKHVDPGWHLFGVPFQEGIGWNDFHLYVSGNPIGLDAAVGLGWIDANVITVQGSVVQNQTPGQPLVPGVAYWVHTLVPLELRAERPADATPAIVPEVAPPAMPDVSPSQPQLVGAQPSSSSEQSTATSVMGWLGAIASFLADAAKGAFEISEGNFAGAGFEFAAGTFGLVEYGLGEATPPTDQFTQMDAKLDTLITDVASISSQIT